MDGVPGYIEHAVRHCMLWALQHRHICSCIFVCTEKTAKSRLLVIKEPTQPVLQSKYVYHPRTYISSGPFERAEMG
jgi:hypothetical protein